MKQDVIEKIRKMPVSITAARPEFIWPEEFDTGNISELTARQLCSIGLIGWAICKSGGKPHSNFGEVVVKIAKRLEITGTPESFYKKAESFNKLGEETIEEAMK